MNSTIENYNLIARYKGLSQCCNKPTVSILGENNEFMGIICTECKKRCVAWSESL